jgi:penicillin-binding protein 1A
MLLGAALAHSKNTVSVKLVDALGVDGVISFARRMGVSSDLPRNLTLALGTGEVYPIELVNAYASIAARGFKADPMFILRVRDRHGTVLEEHPPVLPPWTVGGTAVAAGTQTATAPPAPTPTATAIPSDGTAGAPADFSIPDSGTREDVAYVLTTMMREVVESGTGVAAKALGRPAAAKTGTAQEHRDAWFVGFTPELVAGVWVGFDDHTPLGPRETGAGAALPAWLSFMQAAVGAKAPADFSPPADVELARIDPASGLLANDADAPTLAFVPGTKPAESSHGHGGGSAPQNFFMDDH